MELTTWNGYVWPEWVPEEWRRNIESFWSERMGRSPAKWMDSMKRNRVPEAGARVGVQTFYGSAIGWVCEADAPSARRTGRYVHTWNNMGIVVADDGSCEVVASFR